MDEIFEQMLSVPSWGDGGMSMESLGTLQSLSKMSAMIPTAAHLIGAIENQGLSSQEPEDTLFDAQQDHLQLNNSRALLRRSIESTSMDGGLGMPTYQQSGGAWREPPYTVSIPPLPLQIRGKSGSFPPSRDGMPNDLHLGKRLRDDDDDDDDDDAMKSTVVPQANGDHTHLGPNVNATMKPRVRARRGQATDPHSIAERNRRERIAERMKALQELVPDSNKTDKASMLDEIINYVKFLQMQVKCLSMCRLGGAAAAAPLLADLPSEGAASFIAANLAQANGAAGAIQEGIAFAERQVARLMDEDMSVAMQYLQSKGLCLMPISLATAISSTGQRQAQTAPSESSEVGGNEKRAMELRALAAAASRSATSIVSIGTNDMDMNGSFAKSNIPNTSKETSRNEAVNDKGGLGLSPASSKSGPN